MAGSNGWVLPVVAILLVGSAHAQQDAAVETRTVKPFSELDLCIPFNVSHINVPVNNVCNFVATICQPCYRSGSSTLRAGLAMPSSLAGMPP